MELSEVCGSCEEWHNQRTERKRETASRGAEIQGSPILLVGAHNDEAHNMAPATGRGDGGAERVKTVTSAGDDLDKTAFSRHNVAPPIVIGRR